MKYIADGIPGCEKFDVKPRVFILELHLKSVLRE